MAIIKPAINQCFFLIMSLKKRIKNISLGKKIFTIFVIIAIVILIFYRPNDADHAAAVDREIVIAQRLCEESRGWALNNLSRLKMDESSLKNFSINGQIIKFEHIRYPKVLFFHDGFDHPNSQAELFCEIKDPRTDFMRGTNEYFYDYRRMVWRDNMRTRR